MPANRRYYGDEIANPRIEYGGAMTKWVRPNRNSPVGLFRVSISSLPTILNLSYIVANRRPISPKGASKWLNPSR